MQAAGRDRQRIRPLTESHILFQLRQIMGPRFHSSRDGKLVSVRRHAANTISLRKVSEPWKIMTPGGKRAA